MGYSGPTEQGPTDSPGQMAGELLKCIGTVKWLSSKAEHLYVLTAFEVSLWCGGFCLQCLQSQKEEETIRNEDRDRPHCPRRLAQLLNKDRMNRKGMGVRL